MKKKLHEQPTEKFSNQNFNGFDVFDLNPDTPLSVPNDSDSHPHSPKKRKTYKIRVNTTINKGRKCADIRETFHLMK